MFAVFTADQVEMGMSFKPLQKLHPLTIAKLVVHTKGKKYVLLFRIITTHIVARRVHIKTDVQSVDISGLAKNA